MGLCLRAAATVLRPLGFGCDTLCELLASGGHVALACSRVDQCTVVALLTRCDSLPQSRGARVRRQKYVARQLIQNCEPALKVFQYRWVRLTVREVEPISRHRCLTVRVHQVETTRILARAPGPARATASVSGCEVRCQSEWANAQRLSVGDYPNGGYRREGEGDSVLRVVRSRRTTLEYESACGTRGDRGSRCTLEGCDSTRVIEVRVGIEDELNVLHAETQRSDVCRDLRGRSGKSAVDENVTRSGCDQNRTQSVRADVVRVAVDAKRTLRSIPLCTARARACRIPDDAEFAVCPERDKAGSVRQQSKARGASGERISNCWTALYAG